MSHGGKREGAGRPRKVEEERVRELARTSIVDLYGSEEQGFKHLLNSGDPGLKKWVFEHAFGKPKEKLDLTTDDEKITGLVVEVIRSNGKDKTSN